MENPCTDNANSEIQKEILNIFHEIKKIIERHNLRYFAIGGTCLGAVRHKGFIPWDDDMDIAMPENDYEEFIRIAPKELPSHLKIQMPMKNKNYGLLFIKVHNVNTTCIEKADSRFPDLYKGVFIDVMPLCGIPAKNKTYLKKAQLYGRMNSFFRRHINEHWNIAEKIILYLFWQFGHTFATELTYQKWFNFVTKHKFDESDYTGYVWSSNLWLKPESRIFPKKWFDNYVEMPFEDTMIRCPVCWHEYLTSFFGNYMEIPSEIDRTGHPIAIQDIKHPYSYYIDLFKKGEIKI